MIVSVPSLFWHPVLTFADLLCLGNLNGVDNRGQNRPCKIGPFRGWSGPFGPIGTNSSPPHSHGGTALFVGLPQMEFNKGGFKGCLAALPGDRPFSAFSAPFPAFFALFRTVRRAPGKARKRRNKAFILQICGTPILAQLAPFGPSRSLLSPRLGFPGVSRSLQIRSPQSSSTQSSRMPNSWQIGHWKLLLTTRSIASSQVLTREKHSEGPR